MIFISLFLFLRETAWRCNYFLLCNLRSIMPLLKILLWNFTEFDLLLYFSFLVLLPIYQLSMLSFQMIRVILLHLYGNSINVISELLMNLIWFKIGSELALIMRWLRVIRQRLLMIVCLLDIFREQFHYISWWQHRCDSRTHAWLLVIAPNSKTCWMSRSFIRLMWIIWRCFHYLLSIYWNIIMYSTFISHLTNKFNIYQLDFIFFTFYANSGTALNRSSTKA